MKKFLLFASAFALLTGCSKTEHAPEAPINQKVEGIVFQANLDVNTKGELYQDEATKAWKMFWYAEADKMDVYYANIADPDEPAPTWNTNSMEVYKATRTLGEGYFAAAGTAIDFTVDNNLSFRFVYPTLTKVALDGKDGKDLIATLPAIASQSQSKLNGSDAVGKIFMAGKLDNVAPVNENNPAVADNLVGMQLTRPLPVAFFTFKNYDKELYGRLTSIKLESLGTLKKAATETAPAEYENPSNLDYGSDATYNLETGKFAVGTKDLATSLTVTVSADWEDDAPVFMVMNRVDRSKNTKAEWVRITYTFDNASFEVEKPLGLNASFEAHKLYDMSQGGFDLAAQDYVVLGQNDAILLLNKSFNKSIESIVDADDKINDVAITNIAKIVANVVLSQEDMEYMGKEFTAIKEVTLNENTEIPAFDIEDQVLTKLIAPKVKTIDELAFNAQGGGYLNLSHCILPSYDFKKVAVANALLKSEHLTHLDISAVDLIATTFPATGLSLQDFGKLVEVTVKPGVNVGTKAFDGCAALAEVRFPAGTVGASINLTGEYAFADCELLEEISISNTEIPAGAFAGCTALESVSLAGQAIAPTAIGAEAFKGTAIVNIDLSQAAEIGASAFEDCTALVGVKNPISGVNVLQANAITTLNDNVFKGCTSLKYIGFANVTKVGTGFLEDVTCAEISFGKVITSTTLKAKSFGNTDATTLYVARGQVGVSNADFTLNKVTTTFKAIKN